MNYLDANATEPLRPEARKAACAALDITGNPASIHAAGREARQVLETARLQVAALAGATPERVIFCSGGTEANAMAIGGLAPGRHVLIGATEHDAVRQASRDAETLQVDSNGVLDLGALEAALASGSSALVCLMLANNETGVISPIREAAALCRAYGAALHVDAVQGAGRLPIAISELGADTLALSGHKMGGPAGAGALVLGAGVELPALIAGGGQERGRRGGTPPLAAIAGFGAACEAAQSGNAGTLAGLRDRIEAEAQAAGAIVCGQSAPRLANTACLALPGVRAEAQVIALDLAGFAVSAGAACSSGKVGRSHVLEAMGLGALAGCAIRVSLPWNATAALADAFIPAYAAMAGRCRRSASAA